MRRDLSKEAVRQHKETQQLLTNLGFTDQEMIVIQELSERQKLSPLRILRQALRLYQASCVGLIKCEPTTPPVGLDIVE